MLLRLLRSALGQSDARKLNEEGVRLLQAGHLREAEAAFRSASRRVSFAPACSNLGMLLFEQGRADEALHWLSHAVERDPVHAGARLNLAVALQRLERIERLRRTFPGRCVLRPTIPWSWRIRCVRSWMFATGMP